MTTREAILKTLQVRPHIASELYDELGKQGFSRPSCKVALHRMLEKGEVFRASLNLGHNDSLVSVTENFSDPTIIRKLVDLDFGGRPSVTELVRCLQQSHPVVTKSDVAKMGSLRILGGKTPNWTEVDALMIALCELGIVTKHEEPGDDLWIANRVLFKRAGLEYRRVAPAPTMAILKQKVRFHLAEAMGGWLVQNGFSSSGGISSSAEPRGIAGYCHYPFDLLGFCYASGIKSDKPRPIVGDVLVDLCEEGYAHAFLRRYQEVRRIGKSPLLGFIAAKGFSREAFTVLSRAGLFCWSTDLLLGKSTANAVQRVLEISEKLIRQQELNPQLFAEAFDGFNELPGLFGNIKGNLFEMMVAYFFQRKGYATKMSVKVEALDVDVLATLNNEALIVECKGLAKGNIVDDEFIRLHIGVRTPKMRAKLLDSPVNAPTKFKALVITSGEFSSEVSSEELKTRPDTKAELWNRERFMLELEKDGYTEVIDLVERYF